MTFYYSTPAIPASNDLFSLVGSGYYYCHNDEKVYRVVGAVSENPSNLIERKTRPPECLGTFSCFPDSSQKMLSPLIKISCGYLQRLDDLYYEGLCGAALLFINKTIHNPADSLFMGLYKTQNIRNTLAVMSILKEPFSLANFQDFFGHTYDCFRARDDSLMGEQFDLMTVSLVPEFIINSFEVPEFFEVFKEWYLVRKTSGDRGLNSSLSRIFLIPKALFAPSIKTREGIIHFLVTIIYYAVTWHHLHFLSHQSPAVTPMTVADILGVPTFVPFKLLNVRHFTALTKCWYNPVDVMIGSSATGIEDIDELFTFMRQFLVVFYLIPGSISSNKTIKELYKFLVELLGVDISLDNCNKAFPKIQTMIQDILVNSGVLEHATLHDLYTSVCNIFNKKKTSLAGFFIESTLIPFPCHRETPIVSNIHPTLLKNFYLEIESQRSNLEESAEIAMLSGSFKPFQLQGQVRIYRKLAAIMREYLDSNSDLL